MSVIMFGQCFKGTFGLSFDDCETYGKGELDVGRWVWETAWLEII